jgi:hypothetical protein
MNPISSDIFGRLDWLTKRVKRLCCSVDKVKEDIAAIEDSGAGSYRVFTAIYTQQGVIAGDPPALVNILKNTINNNTPTISYVASGLFNIDFGGAYLTSGKTFVTCSMWADDASSPRVATGFPMDDTNVRIGNTTGDDGNYYIAVEIRVYN